MDAFDTAQWDQGHDGPPPSATETALAFVRAIESRSFEELVLLLAPDHLHVVNGQGFRGEHAIRKVWEDWWRFAPDFTMTVSEVIESGDRVVVVMTVAGSRVVLHGRATQGRWSFPAVAIATVRDGRIAEWQEFGDASPAQQLAG